MSRIRLTAGKILRSETRRFFANKIEGATTSKWSSPHKPGEFPLYDMAVEVIQKDSEQLRSRIQELQKTTAGKQRDSILEEMAVFAEMNRPEVLWASENAQGDMSLPVYRALAKREWKERGKLDHLMQRIHTMNLVPDLLRDFHPSLDLSISMGGQDIEAGVFVDPKVTVEPPQLKTVAFHKDERLYTLVMVDPDSPDPANHTFKQYLHWLVPNIPISSVSQIPLQLTSLDASAAYIPPHPQYGTPYHRFCVFLLENPVSTTKLDIEKVSEVAREHFNLRTFVDKWGFKPHLGGAAHFWRAEWSPSVSEVYDNILKSSEPRYGRPPRVDRYQELKQVRRYI